MWQIQLLITKVYVVMWLRSSQSDQWTSRESRRETANLLSLSVTGVIRTIALSYNTNTNVLITHHRLTIQKVSYLYWYESIPDESPTKATCLNSRPRLEHVVTATNFLSIVVELIFVKNFSVTELLVCGMICRQGLNISAACQHLYVSSELQTCLNGCRCNANKCAIVFILFLW
jgi:hypothetical protein